MIAGLDADGTTDTDDFELATSPLVIVVGSEGRGLARLDADRLRRHGVDSDGPRGRVAQRLGRGRGGAGRGGPPAPGRKPPAEPRRPAVRPPMRSTCGETRASGRQAAGRRKAIRVGPRLAPPGRSWATAAGIATLSRVIIRTVSRCVGSRAPVCAAVLAGGRPCAWPPAPAHRRLLVRRRRLVGRSGSRWWRRPTCGATSSSRSAASTSRSTSVISDPNADPHAFEAERARPAGAVQGRAGRRERRRLRRLHADHAGIARVRGPVINAVDVVRHEPPPTASSTSTSGTTSRPSTRWPTRIADQLTALDPADAADFRANAAAFTGRSPRCRRRSRPSRRRMPGRRWRSPNRFRCT